MYPLEGSGEERGGVNVDVDEGSGECVSMVVPTEFEESGGCDGRVGATGCMDEVGAMILFIFFR